MTTRRILVGGSMLAAASGLLAGPASAQATDPLLQDPAAPVIGNPAGRVTLMEFFDYRCPYCRTMEPVLHALLAKRNDVRVAFREWPIFGGVSVLAARVALASNWQGKFPTVHAALFALGRGMDEAAIRQAAAGAGVDLSQLDGDLAGRSRELDAALANNAQVAHALGFQGTPGFVTGRFKAPGALTLGQLESMIEQADRLG